MTTEERLAHVAENLDRLSQVTNTLAGSIAAHDDQLEVLMRIAEKQSTQIADLIESDRRLQARIEAIAEVTNQNSQQIAATERRWQAYINTPPRQ